MRDGIPHAFPFRLVERREVGDDGARSVVLVTADGAVAAGSAWPVMLVAEALAQSILLVARPEGGGEVRLVALDRVCQFQEVAAGDRLEVEVRSEGTFGSLRRFSCRAVCSGAVVAAADVTVTG
ncbi:MAG: hypothetical protein HXY19_05965 [Thermoanaerobaculaceae bacterium]|nr:hypothetical protein [Thermoanaerobaculaceae bacterium]